MLIAVEYNNMLAAISFLVIFILITLQPPPHPTIPIPHTSILPNA